MEVGDFRITGKELRDFWSNNKTISIGEIRYRVGKMSYGDYFLEPFGTVYGETEKFDPNTLWFKKIDSKLDIYGLEVVSFKQPMNRNSQIKKGG